MSGTDHLGELEQMVLLAILRLGEDAYGRTVRRELEQTADRKVSAGAAYVTLDRLETKGYLRSRTGESEPGRGGRPKRYYRVTEEGKEALASARRSLDRMWSGLEDLVKEG
ncbi:MAG: PadR family transcriptional regulator [Gemmatimonadota bacterium]|jgi:DNA-binding PadR family transcriptional regulator